jgi:CHAT domain-containing protein
LDYEGQFMQSVESYKKGIKLLEEHHDFGNKDLPDFYNDLAYVYGEMSIQPLERVNYSKAFDYIEKYHSDDLDTYTSIYMNYMQALSDYGNKERASEVRKIANSHLRGIEKPLNRFRYYLGEANYLRSFPVKKEIDSLQNDFLLFLAEMPDDIRKKYSNYTFYTLDALGYGMLKLKNFSAAEKIFAHMKTKAETSLDKMKAESNLAAVYFHKEDYQNAAKTYKRSYLYLPVSSQTINSLMLLTARSQSLARSGFTIKAKAVLEKMWKGYFKNELTESILQNSEFEKNSNRWLYILTSSAEVFRRTYELAGKEEDIRFAGLFAEKAAQMFSGYYSKGFFHEDLEENVSTISEELLHFLRLAKPGQHKTEGILNLIENNQSAYVWNKFLLRQFDQNDSAFDDFSTFHYDLSIAETDMEKRHLWQRKFHLLEDINPAWASFVSKQLNMSELRKKLSNDQCLLRYILTKNEVWACVLSRNEVKTFWLGDRKEIETQTKDYFKAVSQRKESYKEIGHLLYQSLLKPLEVKSGNIIIIPEGVLSRLPFEALGSIPLIGQANVSYLNDLKFFDLPVSGRPNNNQVIAFAPEYKNTLGYAQLTSTVKETELLQELFTATVFKGVSATKNRFIEYAPDYDVVHLAMHATSDTVNYGNSSLVFDDGGRLTFDEISALDLPAEMVVLSACNTANGKQLPGEGLMSLSRALTLAGTRSLLHTLWQIPDTETAEIMSGFYQNLADGMTKDEALAKAKREFIQDNPIKRHPWYWAGFVLNGEKSSVQIERKESRIGRFALLIPILLLIIYLISRRRSFAFSRRGKSL